MKLQGYLKAFFAAAGAGLTAAQAAYVARGSLGWYDAIPISLAVVGVGAVVWGVPNGVAK